MGFYIYENWQAGPHKAVIHHGSCGYCNEGKGRAGGYDPNHAEWHGPFGTLEDARNHQQQMNVKVRKECRCVK
jgi:F-type H+-transporting ATPase subunit beta